jgi:molecular chaperone HtpG
MSIEFQSTTLMTYLKIKGLVYYAKVLELRDAVEGWLAYIPTTFPHYTRHTVGHSDEIVRQISRLLFKDEDPKQNVLPLTAVEAYLLAAAAYLHDAGMVASDREKLELLKMDEWKVWISGSNGGAKRWNDIQELRNGAEPADSFVRDFLADLETRFLLAEFIRRAHHLRAKTVIEQHQAMLGRFAFDDLVLRRTIADVCVAHGLRTHELEDNERFPDRRDIRGESVNVRLMAILLRLGDLLDMSADRACPLLLNAACPLPADSLAHWTQYQRITHRLTAPDRIEITAECETQNEHRVLQDWCQWIVDEVRAARTLLSRSKRHHQYELPVAEMEGWDKTIVSPKLYGQLLSLKLGLSVG